MLALDVALCMAIPQACRHGFSTKPLKLYSVASSSSSFNCASSDAAKILSGLTIHDLAMAKHLGLCAAAHKGMCHEDQLVPRVSTTFTLTSFQIEYNTMLPCHSDTRHQLPAINLNLESSGRHALCPL